LTKLWGFICSKLFSVKIKLFLTYLETYIYWNYCIVKSIVRCSQSGKYLVCSYHKFSRSKVKTSKLCKKAHLLLYIYFVYRYWVINISKTTHRKWFIFLQKKKIAILFLFYKVSVLQRIFFLAKTPELLLLYFTSVKN